MQITDLGRSTVEDATVTLNNDVFADIGISDDESRALAASIETLRREPRRQTSSIRRRGARSGSGIVAVTAVPEPGRDRMLSRPPTISARSAIDSRP